MKEIEDQNIRLAQLLHFLKVVSLEDFHKFQELTGNYIQYPEINHNGKEHKKECIYMYN